MCRYSAADVAASNVKCSKLTVHNLLQPSLARLNHSIYGISIVEKTEDLRKSKHCGTIHAAGRCDMLQQLGPGPVAATGGAEHALSCISCIMTAVDSLKL